MPSIHSSHSVEGLHHARSSVYLSPARSCSLPLVGDPAMEQDISPAPATRGLPSPPATPESSCLKVSKRHLSISSDSPVTPETYLSKSSAQLRDRVVQKRWFSADAAGKINKWFNSPDRYIASRGPHDSPERPYRSSKHPNSLSPRERYTRQRDRSVNPFRSTSDSSTHGNIIRGAVIDRSPPRLRPHFVNDDSTHVNRRDGNGGFDLGRQISAGGVWHVGGTAAASGGPPLGVPDGRGGLLGSGTNAPMYNSQFLDRDTPDRDLIRHERRLALALDIDQASRILGGSASPNPFTNQNERPRIGG